MHGYKYTTMTSPSSTDNIRKLVAVVWIYCSHVI